MVFVNGVKRGGAGVIGNVGLEDMGDKGLGHRVADLGRGVGEIVQYIAVGARGVGGAGIVKWEVEYGLGEPLIGWRIVVGGKVDG